MERTLLCTIEILEKLGRKVIGLANLKKIKNKKKIVF